MGKITSLMLLELPKGSNVFCNLKNGAVIATKCCRCIDTDLFNSFSTMDLLLLHAVIFLHLPVSEMCQRKLGFGESCLRIKMLNPSRLWSVFISRLKPFFFLFFFTNDVSALAYWRSITTWVPLMSCICFALSTSTSYSPPYQLIMNTTKEGVMESALSAPTWG